MAVAVPATIAKTHFHNTHHMGLFCFFFSFFHPSAPQSMVVKTTAISGPCFDCPSFNLPNGCKFFKKSPMNGALAIGRGTAATMAIVLWQLARE
jgi:hypothetical protein